MEEEILNEQSEKDFIFSFKLFGFELRLCRRKRKEDESLVQFDINKKFFSNIIDTVYSWFKNLFSVEEETTENKEFENECEEQ